MSKTAHVAKHTVALRKQAVPNASHAGGGGEAAGGKPLSTFVPADVLDSCCSFDAAFSERAFTSWVEQPSACCAASSLAGAINTVGGQRTMSLSDAIELLQRKLLIDVEEVQSLIEPALYPLADILPLWQKKTDVISWLRGLDDSAFGEPVRRALARVRAIEEDEDRLAAAAPSEGLHPAHLSFAWREKKGCHSSPQKRCTPCTPAPLAAIEAVDGVVLRRRAGVRLPCAQLR